MSEEAANWLIEHVIANWDEWGAEAMQAAQCEQSYDAYEDTLRSYLRTAIARATEPKQ